MSEEPIQPESQASISDMITVILAALWVAHPRPISQTTLCEICGGKNHYVEDVLRATAGLIWTDEITFKFKPKTIHGLTDEAVKKYDAMRSRSTT